MNKHLYRIIFNKARGQLMVVGELAKSSCKAPGTRSSTPSNAAPSLFAGQLKAGALVFMLSMLWHAPVHAQIIADSNAPGNQQPIVTSSAAGVPVVNIQTPSGQGVSRNQYSQFDVNAKGAILNNAHNNVQTQLAGWVQGNPLMAGGSARVILNEVNSSNPSLLNGFVEVAGRRAEVVIANPAGLSCDGCGFINATRSTLTTGTPEFNNGQLSGYRVTGGNIEITGQGLNDRSSDYTDLIARAVKVNAGVWANDLAIQTGTQRVNSRRQTIERLSSIAGKPDYSIDVASLGGMYAGKITLKATENGVGVRNAGTIGASAGNVELTADGQLVNRGSITAHTSLSISSSGAINNQNGVLAATNELNLNSHSINNNSGTIASTSGDLTLTTSGQLTNNQGRIESARQLTASTGDFLNDNGLIQAGTLSINTGSKDLSNISGEINASDSLDIDSARINNQMGSIRSGNVLNIQADLIDNSGTQSGDQGISGSEVTLNTKTLNNQQGRIQSSGNTDITASHVIDNSDGLISSSGDLTIADAFQISRAFFNLGNQQSFTNTGGTLIANQNLNLRTGTFSGDGRMLSQGDLSLDLGADLIQTGIIQATGNLTLTSSGLLTNQGQLLAGSGLNLTAENLTNSAQGEISAQETRITATGTVINYGLIDGVTTYLSSRQLQNIGTGRIYGDQVQLSTHTLINREEDNHSAVIAARQSMNIGTYTLTNREHALILSLGDLSIGGELDGSGNSTGKATLIDNKSATIESLNDLTINVTTLNNTNEHFSTEQREISREQIKEYQLSGQSQRYTPDQISTYRDEVLHLVTPTGTRDNFNLYEYQRIVMEDVVLSSDPGQLLASGAITLNVDTLLNDLSIIQAGGDLTGVVGSLTNTDVPGQRLISDSGKVTNYWRDKQKGTDDQGRSVSGYNPATKIEDISLSPTRYEGNTKPTGSGTTVDDRGDHQVTETATSPTSGGLVLLPDNSLFIVSPNPAANFLVQTDPQFTNRKQWLSSDFLLEQAKYDPATTQMRLGDGFYEQKLIREQVAQLTGQRFLEGYASDEDQYRQLMLSGATFAEEVQLRPGIALSDAQISQLSSDIVWLVEETVTLADGSQQQVLVPKVYMRVQENDLSPTGSLLAADNLKLELNNNLLNSGTISGRTSAEITADNINNNGGRIAGGEATLTARDNINNLGGTITAEQRLTLDAGQDINSVSTLRSSSNEQGSNTSISRVASIYVSGDSDGLLLASAGNDLNLIASYLGNESDNGDTRLTANNDITLGTVTESSDMSIVWDSDNWRKDAHSREIGSQVNVTNDIEITAGRDFAATAANITSSSGNASIATGNDLTFKEGRATVFVDEAHKHTGSNGMFSKTTVTTRDTLNQDQAIGSNLSAESLDLQAANNLAFRGSSAVATGDTTLQANNIVLEAAKNTQQQQNLEDKKKSGLFSGGGTGVTIGSQQQTLDTLQTSTTLSGSTVGSIEGNVTMVASNEYRQTASDVNTPAGDISVDAKNIIVEAGHNKNSTVEEQSFKQTGVTLSVTSSVLTALQTAERMKELGEDIDNSRLKVLAGATAALSAKQAYDGAVAASQATTAEGAADAAGVGISISLGSSQQSSTTKRTSSEAQQSAMVSGGNINL
ncbi:filamentous hemagglutinin N-terminal domain-containing protein, partial [Endozoicomonas sp. ALE010]|uniref:two-partner secretion domain-containing protein n=1 Tax=Endozoicomonas sp. ALE010 TaxID=3403081 RepID=UPI003BB73FAB